MADAKGTGKSYTYDDTCDSAKGNRYFPGSPVGPVTPEGMTKAYQKLTGDDANVWYAASGSAGIANIKAAIDQDHPVALLISTDGSGKLATQHWVLVVGYTADSSGNVTDLAILNDDPSGRGDTVTDVSVAEVTRKWSTGYLPRVAPDPFTYVEFE
jgi:hypothetical protein